VDAILKINKKKWGLCSCISILIEFSNQGLSCITGGINPAASGTNIVYNFVQ
jgi:hypothetical protein